MQIKTTMQSLQCSLTTAKIQKDTKVACVGDNDTNRNQ